MGNCPKCDKGFGLFGGGAYLQWGSKVYHSEWNGQFLHFQCFRQARDEESEVMKKLTLCDNCHYYTSDSSSEILDLGLFTPNPQVVTFSSFWCTKFGFTLKDVGKEAEKCTSYITEEEYKEKALRGEINPHMDANFRICSYCQTRYDLNKLSACPKCGAS